MRDEIILTTYIHINNIYIYTNTHIYIHINTHAITLRHTRTHIYTYIHIYIPYPRRPGLWGYNLIMDWESSLYC